MLFTMVCKENVKNVCEVIKVTHKGHSKKLSFLLSYLCHNICPLLPAVLESLRSSIRSFTEGQYELGSKLINMICDTDRNLAGP